MVWVFVSPACFIGQLFCYSLKAFKEGSVDIDKYTEFFTNYTKLTPKFLGAEDDLDVRPPGVKTALTLPYHFTRAPVHFLPGGYVNGQTVRVSYCGYSKFNFLKEKVLKVSVFFCQRFELMMMSGENLENDVQSWRHFDISSKIYISASS